MTTDDCRGVRDALDAVVDGAPPTATQQAHLDGCAACRAELTLARRIEHVLASWPTAPPPAHFAATVAAAARRETWRQEQVVDWGFNLAIGTGLAAVAAGIAGVVWVVGATARGGGAPHAAVETVSALLAAARAQIPVVGTASALLLTTLGAWWWAEERARW